MRGPVAEIRSSPEEQENSAAHLICAVPQLYESLKDLLLATEEALMNNGIRREYTHCEKDKQYAYRALGFAEGGNEPERRWI